MRTKKCITTKYLPNTLTRGARVKATEPDGRSITFGYDDPGMDEAIAKYQGLLDGTEARHYRAALELANRLNWLADGSVLVGGWQGPGTYVWVFAYERDFFNPLP
jgi:hypothetical protein